MLYHWWIHISNKVWAAIIIHFSTVSITLQVCHVLGNLLLTIEPVGKEVKSLCAFITSDFLGKSRTSSHNFTDFPSSLANKLVHNSREPAGSKVLSFTSRVVRMAKVVLNHFLNLCTVFP